jgi:hypothetical protein
MNWTPSDVPVRSNGTTIDQKTLETEKRMGELLVLGIAIGVAVLMFKAGKRIGSRKGYNVGRWRSRRR